MNFPTNFSGWQIGWRPIIFLNIHRTFFQNIEEREGKRGLYLGNDSREENIIGTVSGLVQIPYIHISPAIVNFSIANFHDRALTVIS